MTDFYVYELIATGGERLYVGCTRNFTSRLAQHRHGQEWWPQVDRIIIDVLPTGSDGFAEERRRIRLYQPLHNVLCLGDGADARKAPASTGPWLTVPAAAERARTRTGAVYHALHAGELIGQRRPGDGILQAHVDDIDAWVRGDQSRRSA